MARPRQITDQQILRAAREVFTAHGIDARTSEIAAAAGVSQGTIFKRYPTKRALFDAAMNLPDAPPWSVFTQAQPGGEGAFDAVLTQVITGLLAHLEEIFPRIILTMARCAESRHHCADLSSPPARALRVLRDYLTREQRAGRLTSGEPDVLSRLILGACHHYAFSSHAGLLEVLPLSREVYIQGLVALLMGASSAPSHAPSEA